MAITIKKKPSTGISAENQKGIENHLKAAIHFEAAAKNHRDAAKFHQEGNHDKAFKSTIMAQGNQGIANACQREDVSRHVSDK